MLSAGRPTEIFLCTQPADMRRSFDGLMRMAAEHLEKNVLAGGLFVFFNRRRDRVKLLYRDEDGLAIWYKRLEAGTFELPRAENLDLRRKKDRDRWHAARFELRQQQSVPQFEPRGHSPLLTAGAEV